MKKIFFALSLIVAPLTAMHAQRVVTDNYDRLDVHYQTPELTLGSLPLSTGKADVLQIAGYQLGGEVGSPALPVSIDMITIPFCDGVQVEINNAVYDTFALMGNQTIYPLQPSRSKSDTTPEEAVINAERYATDAFWGLPLASVEVLGVARDRRMANLTFSPVQVNPVTGEVIVCRSADITVRYINPDAEGTQEYFNRYYTPAFSAGTTLNTLLSTKDVSLSTPTRMVIIVPNSLYCAAVDRFAVWKSKQGFNVDIYLYEGESRDTVANYLKSLYAEATAEQPAPAYLLLIGDVNQFPAFESKINSYSMQGLDLDHVTDLYYVTWTNGDNLPDCYQGRFSATDTATVASIINKTLLYEQYAFEDDSYLAHAALVAGEDNGSHQTSGWSADYAWVYSDPTMDYIAKTYVNHANGFDTVSYYKNNVDFAPEGVYVTGYCSSSSSVSALRNLYNEGLGWINYSAHGDWDRWYKPSFTNSNASAMQNNGKPSFMIGNCCLTNKFDKSSCFGETLLRKKDNGGAVAYIGGTNSTLWSEDFYWSVGVRSNISNTMNTSYTSSRLGMYDRLFHTHDEAFENYAITAGALVVSGNMSVNNSSSSYKQYYWEIYELMGDPSLLPWLGRASDLEVSISLSDDNTSITALPHAYVAIIDTLPVAHVVAAGFADADGRISFPYGRLSENFDHYCLSVTAQGHKPYFKAFSDIHVGIEDLSAEQGVNVYPNPATDRVTVSAKDLLRADLLDLTGRTINSFSHSNADMVVLDLSAVPAGIYFLRISTTNGLSTQKLIVNK